LSENRSALGEVSGNFLTPSDRWIGFFATRCILELNRM